MDDYSQDYVLSLQIDSAEKSRVSDVFMIVTLIVVILFFAVVTLLKPDDDFSEQENRVLQQFPTVSFQRLFNGKLNDDITKYYNDQFFARNFFVGTKAFFEICLLKNENNSVILGKDNYLIKREEPLDANKFIEKNAQFLHNLMITAQDSNIPGAVAFVPRPVDVLKPYLPSIFPQNFNDEFWGELDFNLSNYTPEDANNNSEKLGIYANYPKKIENQTDYSSNIPSWKYVDLFSVLTDKINSGEQIYYKTDHHWTTLGAYYAYVELMRSFDETPYSITDFTIETVSDEFYGTTWSSAGMKWIKPDIINYFRYADDDKYTTAIADTNTSFDGFYDVSFLSKKDKYSSFIGGNNARVDIVKTTSGSLKKDEENRKKLLLIKDSYAHSVVPFLARHYDLTIIDPRYYNEPITNLIENENIDRIIIMTQI